MNEIEWRASHDIRELLQILGQLGRTSARKRRLLACACCRRVQHFLAAEGKAALAVGERYADGQATETEAEAAGNRARAVGEARTRTGYAMTAAAWTCWPYADGRHYSSRSAFDGGFTAPLDYALRAGTGVNDPITAYRDWADTLSEAQATEQDVPLRSEDALVLKEGGHVLSLLRCIFGNPFGRGTADPSWPTPAVVAIARGIYEEGRFEELPILADALEDAGCTDGEVLHHCREPEPHARGCWPLDLLLGKA
jgi:hypothetical protein